MRNAEWIEAYLNPFGGRDEPSFTDEEYLVYDQTQDPARFRVEYLESALEVSDIGDSAIYLLNPKVVTPNGEWEAWLFANWLPGASRHRSFAELMQAEYQSFHERDDVSRFWPRAAGDARKPSVVGANDGSSTTVRAGCGTRVDRRPAISAHCGVFRAHLWKDRHSAAIP